MKVTKTIKAKENTYYLRPYNENDEDKVIELWEAAFNTKMDSRMWRWKYLDNPFGKQIMLCFTDKGLPIAMYSGIPFTANLNGINIKMTQLIDNLSHPDYRQATSGRKGLFIQNGEHFVDVYTGQNTSMFLYGFPGQRAYRLGKVFLQYTKLSDGGAYLYADVRKLKGNRLPVLGSVKKTSSATIEFDKLWEDAKSYYPFSVKRNQMFIQWRFFEHPINKYTIYAYRDRSENMLAYVVINIKDSMATIVDVFALPQKIVLRALLKRIKNELLSDGVSSIQVWLPKKHFITKYLIQSGFELKDEPTGITPTGRSFDKMLDIEFAKHKIFYTMGDGDLF